MSSLQILPVCPSMFCIRRNSNPPKLWVWWFFMETPPTHHHHASIDASNMLTLQILWECSSMLCIRGNSDSVRYSFKVPKIDMGFHLIRQGLRLPGFVELPLFSPSHLNMRRGKINTQLKSRVTHEFPKLQFHTTSTNGRIFCRTRI